MLYTSALLPTHSSPHIRHQSLLSLCSWWGSTHEQTDPLPHICYQYTSPDKLHTGLIAPPLEYNFPIVASDMLTDKVASDNDVDDDASDGVGHAVNWLGRSLGLLGLVLGVVLLLFIIAFLSCMRRRKVVQVKS